MSKKSFNDIESAIREALEANEPAFKEASWKKMEALLDKDDNRRRPFIFWLWFLVPLLIVSSGLGYYVYTSKGTDTKPQELVTEKNRTTTGDQTDQLAVSAGPAHTAPANSSAEKITPAAPGSLPASFTPVASASSATPESNNAGDDHSSVKMNSGKTNDQKPGSPVTTNKQADITQDSEKYAKNKLKYQANNKTKVAISPGTAEEDDDIQAAKEITSPAAMNGSVIAPKAEEDIVVVKIETENPGKKDEKEIEKILDSVIGKTVADKKDKKDNQKTARFFVIVAAGAEGSGTKLFSVDKITSRAGLAAGYNINSRLSVQAGFFVSSKKYTADGSSYKTKPGTYWNIVDIKEVEANCRVYEIPLQVNYNFTPGKKLNFFASAGLSSYIMKKEDYSFYYTRYGVPHNADAYYRGNKNLFSVLKVSAGVEKKLGRQFSVFAVPGVSIPLSGVGEGEVKLYSTELMFGLKFTPARKNK